MEQKERQPCEDGTTVSPSTETPGTPGGGGSVKDGESQPSKEKSPEGTAKQEGDGNGLDTECPGSERAEVESPGRAQLHEEDSEKKAPTEETREEITNRDTEPKSESLEDEAKETPEVSEKAQENKTEPEAKEKAMGNEKPQDEAREDGGPREITEDSPEENAKTEEPKAEAQEEDSAPEIKPDAQEVEAKTYTQKENSKEEVEPDSTQNDGVARESEEGAGEVPSSPEGWPESPTEEGFSPDGLSPEETAGGETSPSASEPAGGEAPQSQSPSEQSPAPAPERRKERLPERRGAAPARPRGPRAQNRRAIVDKFGGAASGTTALFRNPKAAGAAIGGVKSMLLEWCKAMTRNYEHVDIQNFSSSWSSGMAFCALIHKFFPDAFDYAALDPKQRRHNFTLAFSTAEKLADCAQLLEVDDMVRLSVPDSKCVYTYIQELYRSLVQKGLVKTKKK